MDVMELHKILPELSLLKDEKMRHQCELVWLEILTESGWNVENILSCPVGKSLREDSSERCITHCRRVVRLCNVIYHSMEDLFENVGPCNYDILIAAALLHDVGKFAEYHQKEENRLFKHPCIGAWYAKKYGLPEKVIHAVLEHSDKLSPEGERAKMTPESLILKKADYLCWDYVALYDKKEGKN